MGNSDRPIKDELNERIDAVLRELKDLEVLALDPSQSAVRYAINSAMGPLHAARLLSISTWDEL